MEPHIGEDAESGRVHTVVDRAANVNDVVQAGALLPAQELAALGGAGYRGVDKRPGAQGPTWHVAMQPGIHKALDTTMARARLLDKAEQLEASVRAKVEPMFLVAKQQVGHTKALYGSLGRKTARLTTLFAPGPP